MKGTLIKTDKGYILEGNNLPNPRRLSIKNCQAIERGYDLDELVKSKYPNVDNEDYEYDSEAEMLRDDYMSSGFLKGAKAILEILGDKKFSEQQIRKAIELAWRNKDSDKVDIIKTIQQETEWEVEVVMDRIPADLAPGGWDEFPKLDADGCLILKRIQ